MSSGLLAQAGIDDSGVVPDPAVKQACPPLTQPLAVVLVPVNVSLSEVAGTGVGIGLPVCIGVGDGMGVALWTGVGDSVGKADGDPLGAGDADPPGAGDGEPLGMGDADPLARGVGEPLGDGVAGTGVGALTDRPYSATQTLPFAGIAKPKRPTTETIVEVVLATIVPGPL